MAENVRSRIGKVKRRGREIFAGCDAGEKRRRAAAAQDALRSKCRADGAEAWLANPSPMIAGAVRI